MAENATLSTDDHSELVALYHATVDDLAFFKKQQWTVTYYVLLLYAAIVTLLGTLSRVTPCERVLAIAATIAVAILGCWQIANLGTALDVRRERLKATIANFGKAFQEARDAMPKPAGSDDLTRVAAIMYFAIVAGGLATVWTAIRPLIVPPS